MRFEALKLGEVRPQGWLLGQLRLQAAGLPGRLDEFWPDVAQSGWIGGAGEGWERGPCWLDGLVPLAFVLGDEALIAKARHWVEEILVRQQADGWLGPRQQAGGAADNEADRVLDVWPQFIVYKALTQWAEAGDARIEPALRRALGCVHALLQEQPLSSWAQMRWPELLLTIDWLGNRGADEQLLQLARLAQAQGYDWAAHFNDFKFTAKQSETSLQNHGVNHAIMLKAPALLHLLEGGTDSAATAKQWIGILDEYHGQASGLFSCDELLAGLHPSQGVELCSVVEYMYSLEQLLLAFGDIAFAERLESLAYNALPATFSPDMWSHQYVQQPNQVVCRISEERIYTNNGADANTFGLEPHYGCCTANCGQGWPKFATHLWLRAEDGLMAVSYAPCEVATHIGDTAVKINVSGDYPFDEQVDITVTVSEPVDFALHLPIPSWTEGATLAVGDESEIELPSGSFFVVRREWQGSTKLRLRLPMPVRILERPGGAVSIARGPLLYALPIQEEWVQRGGVLPHADYEVLPRGPWNYALLVDGAAAERSFTFKQGTVGELPFSPQGAPVRLGVRGRRVDGWNIERNAAGAPPQSVAADGPLEELELVPYGCTNLRVTEFPLAGLLTDV